jgi:hypothetical protein
MAPPDNSLVIPYQQLEAMLSEAKSPAELYLAVADGPFAFKLEMALLFLGFICFYTVDEAAQVIKPGAVSDTEHYHQSIEGYDFKLEDYKIALDDAKNIVALAVRDKTEVCTEDWGLLSRPEAREEVARLNQANSGIAYSLVQPLTGKVRGAMMYNYYTYKENISEQQQEFMDRYTAMASAAIDKLS